MQPKSSPAESTPVSIQEELFTKDDFGLSSYIKIQREFQGKSHDNLKVNLDILNELLKELSCSRNAPDTHTLTWLT